MNEEMIQHLVQKLSGFLNIPVQSTDCKQVYGGDINLTYVLRTNEDIFFVKTNTTALPNLFQKEYNGLQLLYGKSPLKVPLPFIHGIYENRQYLVTSYLEKAPQTKAIWCHLGEGIALLHTHTNAAFGLDEDNYLGNRLQTNTPAINWTDFYARERVLPLFRQALKQKYCTAGDMRTAEQLCNKMNDLFPQEPPALLHGDLWSGNVMSCSGAVAAIFDPAVYYGNREMDIAMTLLFGGFDDLFYHTYNEVNPLQSGWQQRVALCQLYPLLFHLVTFGSSYYSRVESVLNKYA